MVNSEELIGTTGVYGHNLPISKSLVGPFYHSWNFVGVILSQPVDTLQIQVKTSTFAVNLTNNNK
jgi:hypothetical protein